jgi:TRAP-type uncharacterized transport system substrate-binding protein
VSKRDILGYLSLLLAAIAAAVFAWYMYFVPHTLRIGVSPAGSEPAQFLSALANSLKQQAAPVRLVVVPFATGEEVTKALDLKRLDLAVVRTDDNLPTSALGVAILHQFVVTTLARPESDVKKFGDLKGRTVGILGRGQSNLKLFEILAGLHGIPVGSIKTRIINAPESLATTEGADKLDAIFIIAPRGGRGLVLTYRAYEALTRAAPVVLPMGEVGSMMTRNPAFAKGEIVPGELSNSPVTPAAAVATITFPALIVAHRQLASAAVEEFTKHLFGLRQSLATQFPAGAAIAALSTERDAAFAVHPGAVVYYDASETPFLERYSDLMWLVLFGFSGVASAAAWLWSKALPRQQELVRTEFSDIVALIDRAREATEAVELDAIERAADKLVVQVAEQIFKGVITTEQQQPSFDLLFARLGTIIEDKRRQFSP